MHFTRTHFSVTIRNGTRAGGCHPVPHFHLGSFEANVPVFNGARFAGQVSWSQTCGAPPFSIRSHQPAF